MLKLITFLSFVFTSSVAFSHGIHPVDIDTLINDSRWQDFIRIGAEHMISGYDHILFLIALTFLVNNVKDIITYITLFTIGHSISLIFATKYGVSMNTYLVDAFIALTVCYKAFDNINNVKQYRVKMLPILPMVGFFGLVHGFGLSTKLQEATQNHDVSIYNIVSFNIGVEFGQMIVLLVVLTFKQIFTNQFTKLALPSNYLLFGAGIYLFIYQLILYTN